VNFCGSDGANTSCANYGGSYLAQFVPEETSYLTCEQFGLAWLKTTSVEIGIRCCADAIPPP
jgi:hypothetical protein